MQKIKYTAGWWKLFITGQAKLSALRTIQISTWAADNFTTTDILFLSVILLIIAKSNRSKNHTVTLLIT